jgi:hypothetical protein
VKERHRAPQKKEGTLHRRRKSVRPAKASDRSAGRVERLRAAARIAGNNEALREDASGEKFSPREKGCGTRSAKPRAGLRRADVPQHGQQS